ncbi:MAG: TIGR04283 family arsenosugar biosynthesis glycosyltransferase [Desulfovermiculus sp.]
MRLLYGKDLSYRIQSSGDLGEKMYQAFRESWSTADSRLILIGADCPGLTPYTLGQALDALCSSELVLGPALDGGYYLLGVHRKLGLENIRELLRGIEWGGERVLAQTRDKAAALGLQPAYLHPAQDIDRPEDLQNLPQLQNREANPRLSVIVPTLNEQAHLEATLELLLEADNVQVIVADGGSTDATRRIAEAQGVQMVSSRAGRAAQMNSGAQAAVGQILLFVHADTKLPFLYEHMLRRAVLEQGRPGGSFRFGLDQHFFGARLVSALVNLRARYLGLPYGDQALFVRRDVFERLGGYPEVPIMEDVKLVRAMQGYGPMALIPAPALTSARRWQELGVLKTAWINQKVLLSSVLGLSLSRLQRSYREAAPGLFKKQK